MTQPKSSGLHLAALVVASVLTTACGGSTATLNFKCDPVVNGGTLGTDDVVRGSESDARRIRELGERWFYDSARNGMGDRLKTLTFPMTSPDGKCEAKVPVSAQKGDEFLVVVADYKFQNQAGGQQILVLDKKKWKGKKLEISVHDKEITLR